MSQPAPTARPPRRATAKVSYKEEGVYPDGKPGDEIERAMHEFNLQSFPESDTAIVDAILVTALYSSKNRWHSRKAMDLETIVQAACTAEEVLSIARFLNNQQSLDKNTPTSEGALVLARNLCQMWPAIFSRKWIPLIQHLLYRYYMLYSTHSYVRLDKVSFKGAAYAAGLRATRDIAAGQFLLTTCSSMCIDEATTLSSRLSVIQPSAGHLGPKAPRVLLGPFRFANHDCDPNAQIMPIRQTHAYGICAIRDIRAGSPVTVSYHRNGYYAYSGDESACACKTCNPNQPPTRTHAGTGPMPSEAGATSDPHASESSSTIQIGNSRESVSAPHVIDTGVAPSDPTNPLNATIMSASDNERRQRLINTSSRDARKLNIVDRQDRLTYRAEAGTSSADPAQSAEAEGLPTETHQMSPNTPQLGVSSTADNWPSPDLASTPAGARIPPSVDQVAGSIPPAPPALGDTSTASNAAPRASSVRPEVRRTVKPSVVFPFPAHLQGNALRAYLVERRAKRTAAASAGKQAVDPEPMVVDEPAPAVVQPINPMQARPPTRPAVSSIAPSPSPPSSSAPGWVTLPPRSAKLSGKAMRGRAMPIVAMVPPASKDTIPPKAKHATRRHDADPTSAPPLLGDSGADLQSGNASPISRAGSGDGGEGGRPVRESVLPLVGRKASSGDQPLGRATTSEKGKARAVSEDDDEGGLDERLSRIWEDTDDFRLAGPPENTPFPLHMDEDEAILMDHEQRTALIDDILKHAPSDAEVITRESMQWAHTKIISLAKQVEQAEAVTRHYARLIRIQSGLGESRRRLLSDVMFVRAGRQAMIARHASLDGREALLKARERSLAEREKARNTALASEREAPILSILRGPDEVAAMSQEERGLLLAFEHMVKKISEHEDKFGRIENHMAEQGNLLRAQVKADADIVGAVRGIADHMWDNYEWENLKKSEQDQIRVREEVSRAHTARMRRERMPGASGTDSDPERDAMETEP